MPSTYANDSVKARRARHRSALADDDARQDRHHRQYTRREREEQPGPEELCQRQPQTTVREHRRQSVALRSFPLQAPPRFRARGARGADVAPLDATASARKRHVSGLRRVTQSRIGAALIPDRGFEHVAGRRGTRHGYPRLGFGGSRPAPRRSTRRSSSCRAESPVSPSTNPLPSGTANSNRCRYR